MRTISRIRSLSCAGAAASLALLALASCPALAAPAPLARPAASPAETAVPSAVGQSSPAKRGSWAKVYPVKDSCQKDPDKENCDYEKDGIQQPVIPEVKSPLGTVPQVKTVEDAAPRTRDAAPRAVSMVLKKEVDSTTANAVPLDTSVAAAGTKVVYVQNSNISVSADSGVTFSTPRVVSTLYSDSPGGGVCCDMVVNYVPTIDRFVWVTQYRAGSDGKNLYRLAVFPPSAVTATGISSWTYWDIAAAQLPGTPGFLDFPELSFGSSYLYLGFHAGDPGTGKVYKGDIVRIGLVNLRDSLNLSAGATAWRFYVGSWSIGTVAQNTGSRAYWASNTSTAAINVGWWDEASTSLYPTHSITTYNWPNADYTSTVGADQWLNTYNGLVLGAARNGDNLYFAWTAARGSGSLAWIKNPNVQFLTLKGANSGTLSLSDQRTLWNANYAIGYPNINVMNGDVALTFAVGGGTTWPRSGIMDITATPTSYMSFTTGTASCNCGRWGDYAAVRPWPNYSGGTDQAAKKAFIASGYSIHQVTPQGGSPVLRQVGAVAAITP